MEWFKRPGWYYGALIIASAAYFAPVWTNPGEIVYTKHSDILSQHYPWRTFAITSLRETRSLPLWTPYSCSGQPFQADAQTTLFYPPHFIFYCVPRSWIGPLFGFLVWLHVLIAGLTMFAYARHRQLQPVSALIAGFGFMFAGKWLLHIILAGHYVFAPIAWFPLVLLFLERAIERRRLLWAVAGGLVEAVMITGLQPQLTLYGFMVAGIWTLWPALGSQVKGERESAGPKQGQTESPGEIARGSAFGKVLTGLMWWLLAWGTATLIAGGLAAVQILPSFESATSTTRVHVPTPEYGQFYDLTFHTWQQFGQRLLSLVGPQNFGANLWENVGAFGVFWTASAVLALALCRSPRVWFEGGVWLWIVIFSFGSSLPLYPWLRQWVPLLAAFRIPARMLVLAGFPLGMLAGHLTEAIFASRPKSKSIIWAALFIFLSVYWYFTVSLSTDSSGYRYWWWATILGPLAILALIGQYLRPARGSLLAPVWAFVLLADLWGLHHHHLKTKPVAEVYPPNDAIRFLKANPGSFRVLDLPISLGLPTFSPLTNALVNLYAIEWARGLNVTDIWRYKQYLNYVAGTDALPEVREIPIVPTIEDQQLLDLLAVRFYFVPVKTALPTKIQKEWKPVHRLVDTRIFVEADSTRGGMQDLIPYEVYERKVNLPRAFILAQAQLLSSDTDRFQALKSVDLHKTVLLDHPSTLLYPDSPPVIHSFPGPAFQDAKIVLREPNRVIVETDRQDPGYLVLLDVWYPGWECFTEDGQRLPVWQGNTLFRAVLAPPGHHRLEFVFRPRSFQLGLAFSLGTLIMVFCLGGWMWIATVRAAKRKAVP